MKKRLMLIITAVAVIASAYVSYGTTNYWDNNGSDAGFGSAGGTWGLDTLWSTDSLGLLTPAVTDTGVGDDLYFGTDASGLASGTIIVNGTSQAFKTMTFGAASGEVTLSGGTITLASPSSSINVNSASNTIGSVLAGSNGLLVQLEAKNLIYPAYLTTNPVVIFPGAMLADYDRVGGMMGGLSVSFGRASVFYFTNTSTTATYQLQVSDGGYIKCVKVELTQAESGISARAVYARYISGQPLGFDFDTGSPTESTRRRSRNKHCEKHAPGRLHWRWRFSGRGINSWSSGPGHGLFFQKRRYHRKLAVTNDKQLSLFKMC